MTKRWLIAGLLVMAGCVQNGTGTHWGYSGEAGPAHWGEISPACATCASGKNQSPINLTDFVEADLKAIKIDYKVGGNEILNNGHTVEVSYTPGSQISVNGHAFELKQFHFHAPSENHINGQSYPMEMHLVHADKDGNLAVVAVMFQEGQANASLAKAWSYMPQKKDDKHSLPSHVAAEGLLPVNRDYYRFNGSLTTPPCTEGVLWLVMKHAVTASKAQIEAFTHVMHHPNNRPIQPTNARPVLQ